MNKLFEDLPFPWKLEGEDVIAANNQVVYCNTQYYPYCCLSEDEWLKIIEVMNNYELSNRPDNKE